MHKKFQVYKIAHFRAHIQESDPYSRGFVAVAKELGPMSTGNVYINQSIGATYQ